MDGPVVDGRRNPAETRIVQRLTERSRPLQREQDALPGAEILVVQVIVAIFVVLPEFFLCRDDVRQLQQEQKRRTQSDQQGQH